LFAVQLIVCYTDHNKDKPPQKVSARLQRNFTRGQAENILHYHARSSNSGSFAQRVIEKFKALPTISESRRAWYDSCLLLEPLPRFLNNFRDSAIAAIQTAPKIAASERDAFVRRALRGLLKPGLITGWDTLQSLIANLPTKAVEITIYNRLSVFNTLSNEVDFLRTWLLQTASEVFIEDLGECLLLFIVYCLLFIVYCLLLLFIVYY
jgi:hypothetical protein